MQKTFFNQQLVLIGGGHANVQVLRKLCMNEFKGLNVILISEYYDAIYSGMTPGFIKKIYSLKEIFPSYLLYNAKLNSKAATPPPTMLTFLCEECSMILSI